MRLIVLAATASLCLLAGCNRGAANNSANAPAPVENVAVPETEAPPAETPAPANAAGPSAGASAANEIAECVRDGERNLPAGTDVNAFCTCAVGKMTTNQTPQRDAINQCATEMNITLPTRQ